MSINPKCIANLPTANIKELQKQYKKGPLNPGSAFEWIKHPIKQDPLWGKGKWPSIITIAKSVSDQHQISIKPIDLAWHNFNTRDAKEINFYLKHLSNCTEVDRRKRNFRFSNKPNFDEIFWKPVAKKEPPKKQKNVPKHKPATLNDKDCDYIISSECPHNDPNGNLKPGQECKCKCIFEFSGTGSINHL